MSSRLAQLYQPFTYLEKLLVRFFKTTPHLPESVTNFIAKYVWLVVLVDVIATIALLALAVYIVSAIGAGDTSSGFMVHMSTYLSQLDKAMDLAPWYTHVASYASSIVFYGMTILQIASVYFLLHRRRMGWALLYVATVCLLVQDVISLLYPLFNIGDFIFSVVFDLILLYVVFEIRGNFTHPRLKKPRTTT